MLAYYIVLYTPFNDTALDLQSTYTISAAAAAAAVTINGLKDR